MFKASDSSLVRRTIGGRPEAFEQLVLRYFGKAYAVARSVGLQAATAEDVVQESFLKAFRNIGRLKHPRRFGAWFLTIVRNTARTHAGGRESLVLFSDLGGELEAGASSSHEAHEFRQYLWSQVESLPDAVREAIFLFYYEGESRAGVARALGLSVSGVKKRLRHGREKLRSKLWRELERCLRQDVPAASESSRRARRLALLVLASIPATWTFASRAAASSGLSWGLPSKILPPIVSQGAGVIIMSQKKLLSIIGVLFVVAGAGTWWADPFDWRRAEPLVSRPARTLARAERTIGTSLNTMTGGTARDSGSREPRELEGAPRSLLGTVTDEFTGEPIAGARVVAIPLKSWDQVSARVDRSMDPFRPDEAARLQRLENAYSKLAASLVDRVTDDDGTFLFDELSAGNYRLAVEHARYLSDVQSVVAVRSDEPSGCDVSLVPGSSIAGQVVDAAKQPVEGALVSARRVGTHAASVKSKSNEFEEQWRSGEALLGTGRSVTDAEGRFQLSSLEPTLYELQAEKHGFLTASADEVEAGSGDVVVVLDRGSRIRGRVWSPDRDPVGQALVKVTRLGNEELHKAFASRVADVEPPGARLEETDSRGVFAIAGFEAGRYLISIDSPSFPLFRQRLDLTNRSVDMGDVILEPPRAIEGVVVDASGAAIPGARVWIDPPYEKRGAYRSRIALPPPATGPLTEDASTVHGTFALGPLSSGSYSVHASADGFAEAVAVFATESNSELRIVMTRGGRVVGRVVDHETSEAVEGALVSLGLHGDMEATTDADGGFQVTDVPHEALSLSDSIVRVRHPDYGSYEERRVTLAGRDEGSPLLIRLPRGVLSGRVVDRYGQGVPGARVWLERESKVLYCSLAQRSARTDGDGTFSIAAAPGDFLRHGEVHEFFVAASHGSEGVGRVGPLRPPGSRQSWNDVTIELVSPVTIEGKVTDHAGKAVAGARVVVTRRSEHGLICRDGPTRAAWTVPDGRFRVSGVEAGGVEIRVSKPGHAPLIESGEVLTDVSLRFELGKGVEISGWVVDSDGNPVAGAEVLAVPDEPLAQRSSEFRNRMHLLVTTGEARTLTASDGRFRLGNLRPTEYALIGRARGYEASRVPSVRLGEQSVKIVFERFSAMFGRVRAAGDAAISTFSIEVFDRDKIDGHRTRAASLGRLQFHDPGGWFFVDGLTGGHYQMRVRSHGFVTVTRDVELKSGEEREIEVSLERGVTATGIVRDAKTDRPIPGATVKARPISRSSIWSWIGLDSSQVSNESVRTQTGDDGRFELSGLLEGEYRFQVMRPTYKTAEKKPVEVAVNGESSELTFELEPAARLEGRVSGYDWHRMNCSIILTRLEEQAADGDNGSRIFVHMLGTFSLDGLTPGAYRVELQKQDVRLGEVEYFGPTGASQGFAWRGELETMEVREVTLREGKVTVLDFDLPAD